MFSTECDHLSVPPEFFFVVLVAAPSLAFLAGAYAASGLKLREFSRAVRHFDEDTQSYRKFTPRVRMTLYRKLIDKTRRTKMPAPPVPEKEALERKFVFLSLKPPPGSHDTVRDLRPPIEEPDDQVTLRMQR